MVRPARLIVATLVLALAFPMSAAAATVREYQLQYAPTGDADGALMIVNALLDPQESLPASVSVPVPSGATLLWAGEILGGDPALDPVRETTVERVDGVDIYTMTLEKAYTGQLEIKLAPPEVSGKTVKASVTWTNPADEVLVTGSVITEAGATDVKLDPESSGQIQTNEMGESLYPLTGVRVPKGGDYAITVSWKRPTGTAGASGSSPVLPILLGALVAAVLALIAVITRERTRTRRARASRED